MSGVSQRDGETSAADTAPWEAAGVLDPTSWKRALDVVAAAGVLIVALPLLAVLAAAIRIVSAGPVFSREERIGKDCRPFQLLRFRSRRTARLDDRAPRGEEPPRPRLLRFLRRSGLESLPALWNVLRGDMSLVGPWPETSREVRRRPGEAAEVLRIRPGLIDPARGLWRGGAARREIGPRRGGAAESERRLVAKEYALRASVRTDLRILAAAVWTHVAALLRKPATRVVGGLLRRTARIRRSLAIGVQGALVLLSASLAWLLRFDELPPAYRELFLTSLPILLACRMAALGAFGLFAGLWRYASARDMRAIAGAVSASSFALIVIARVAPPLRGYPLSVILIDTLLLGFLLSAIRVTRRVVRGLSRAGVASRRVLVVGAGDAGDALLREIEMHPDYGYRVVGFVDDDRTKVGTMIRGVRVLGTRSDMERVLRTHPAREILIAIPSATPEQLQAIVQDCRRLGLPVKMLPGFKDLLFPGRLLGAIRDVAPEDLLCRPPVATASPELEVSYRGKALMVTGAGGSIGSELVRQLARYGPSRLVLYERHEHSLYLIEMELRRTMPGCPIVPVIGDILDAQRAAAVLKEHRPEVVFHAAAYKHVPMMELNPHEAVKVNVLGTKNMAELARKAGVRRFILISSDKAVEPSSVMGATKRVGELVLQDLAREADGGTRFLAVRFGNVLESSGSVVPLFRDQIKRGGPVTVTHPEITRFFMTTAEAVHLVLHAGVMGQGGEVYVLDMGEPVKVIDMARQLIRVYGYEPDRDIEIAITGLRPGEKLHEVLFDANEEIQPTAHPKIRKAVRRRGEKRLWQGEKAFLALRDLALDGATRAEVKESLERVANACRVPWLEQNARS